MTRQYLLGVIHDGTERHTTYRIATNSKAFVEFLQKGIRTLSVGAWIYKEGKSRNLWIVEFSKKILKHVIVKSRKDKIEYIRGYFDAEGGIAKQTFVRYYLYFCQKDKKDLLQVKTYLEDVGIRSGLLHNPSKKVDPNYWRFYISAKSYSDFAQIIGSDHPEKCRYLRMKI
jgi:intein/homing endonuclease